MSFRCSDSKRAGADGFMTKGNPDWLEEAIVRAARGKLAVFEDAVRRVWDGGLLCEELTEKEIAAVLAGGLIARMFQQDSFSEEMFHTDLNGVSLVS